MSDLLVQVKRYIDDRIELYGPFTIDGFVEESECLTAIHDPSTDNTIVYMDGSSEGNQVIAFLARSKTKSTALSALGDIRDLFNLERFPPVGGGYKIERAEVVTLPAFVSTADTGESVYTFAVNFMYSKE